MLWPLQRSPAASMVVFSTECECVYTSFNMVACGLKQNPLKRFQGVDEVSASIQVRNRVHEMFKKGCFSKAVLEMIILLAHMKKNDQKKCLHLTIFRPSFIISAHFHLQSK